MQAIVDSPADLGRLVRRTRETHAISQRELAERLGVTQRWLSELESGKGKQINERYFAVLAALGIRLTAHAVSDRVPAFIAEHAENLRSGDRAWTRALPPPIALSATR